MAEVQSKTIKTLLQFVKFFEGLSAVPHWYRGCRDTSNPLLPGLYRHPTKKQIEELLQLEDELLAWFRRKSVPYQTRQLNNAWEYLFFMQHYLVPTRLLDWTENPLVALYFALTGACGNWAKEMPESTDAAVWVLNPGVWNQKALEEIGYERGVLTVEDEQLNGHKPGHPLDQMRTKPVALHGTHNSPRIVAQRGTFVIFGKDTRPMEEICGALDFPTGALVKLSIPAESIASLLRSLAKVGITDSLVFPDLQGLALEARREFGFEV